jgi:hypothetical protein
MNYIHGAETHLGKVVQARQGATYELLVETWDDADGVIPTKTECEAGFMSWQAREAALAAIRTLESAITLRRLREAMSDTASGTTAGRKWLKDQDALIAVERTKL